jgi:hypothetical protein
LIANSTVAFKAVIRFSHQRKAAFRVSCPGHYIAFVVFTVLASKKFRRAVSQTA